MILKDIRNTDCKLCTLHKVSEAVCLCGEGNDHADVMFVGEAPGKTEITLGRPFVGRAGKFLRKHMLQVADIDIDTVYLTNAVRCRPQQNKTPSLHQVRACRRYLEAEIAKVKPKVIVLLGNVPLASILYADEVGGITNWRGKVVWSREFNCWVVPTFHPSALMRDVSQNIRYRYERSVDDVEKVSQVVSWDAPSFHDIRLVSITTTEVLESYLASANQVGMLSIDLETDGFDPNNEILGVSMCFKRTRYNPVYVAWGLIEKSMDMFKSVMQNPDVVKIGHNLPFDQKFLYYHGVRLGGKLYDTMSAVHLLDENFPKGLKDNTWRYLHFGGYDKDLQKYRIENRFAKYTSYKGIPYEILWKYSAYDALATHMLYERCTEGMANRGLLWLYEKVISPARTILTTAEITGISVDTDYIKSLDVKFGTAVDSIVQKLKKIVKVEFNPDSHNDLARVLFTVMKFKPVKYTSTGKPSVDAEVLERLKGQKKGRAGDFLDLLLMRNNLNYIRKTFLLQPLRFVWPDGRVHPSFDITGTVTGRSTNSRPGTHNIPSDRLIRTMYLASPGCKLVEGDIKAAELRVVALESNEDTFLKAFKNGVDIHNTTYNTVFDKPADYVPTKEERRIAKSINFGLIYGVTASGLSRQIGCSYADAESFMERYFEKLPKIRSFMKLIVDKAKRQGYVESIFGRRRHIPDIGVCDDEKSYYRMSRQAQNATIQSAAADYTYIGIIRLQRALVANNMRSRIIHTVHDCVIVDALADEVDDVVKMMKDSFEKPVSRFPIKMEIDISVMNRWGEKNESELEKILDKVKEGR